MMGQDLLPPSVSEKPPVGMNPENLRRRDSKSRELLGPLFGQVAVATVRNVLSNGVANLQNLDKMLEERVAQLRERKEQLQLMKSEDERQHVIQLLEQQESSAADCSIQHEEHDNLDASYTLQNEELKHLKDE